VARGPARTARPSDATAGPAGSPGRAGRPSCRALALAGQHRRAQRLLKTLAGYRTAGRQHPHPVLGQRSTDRSLPSTSRSCTPRRLRPVPTHSRGPAPSALVRVEPPVGIEPMPAAYKVHGAPCVPIRGHPAGGRAPRVSPGVRRRTGANDTRIEATARLPASRTHTCYSPLPYLRFDCCPPGAPGWSSVTLPPTGARPRE